MRQMESHFLGKEDQRNSQKTKGNGSSNILEESKFYWALNKFVFDLLFFFSSFFSCFLLLFLLLLQEDSFSRFLKWLWSSRERFSEKNTTQKGTRDPDPGFPFASPFFLMNCTTALLINSWDCPSMELCTKWQWPLASSSCLQQNGVPPSLIKQELIQKERWFLLNPSKRKCPFLAPSKEPKCSQFHLICPLEIPFPCHWTPPYEERKDEKNEVIELSQSETFFRIVSQGKKTWVFHKS